MEVFGWVDEANPHRISGWAIGRKDGQTVPVTVDIAVDGLKVASVPAEEARPDVVSGIDQARCGFSYSFPEPLSVGRHRVSIQAGGTGIDLRGFSGWITVTPSPPEALEHSVDHVLANGGAEFLDHLIKNCNLLSSSRVLEIGCGFGDLAIPLLDHLDDNGAYAGLDAADGAIHWCREHLSPISPKFRFDMMHVGSGLPGADRANGVQYRFPYIDGSFDVVVARSVLTRVPQQAVCDYLNEIGRVLSPNGKALIGVFLLNNDSRYLIERNKSRLLTFRNGGYPCYFESDARPEMGVAFDEGWFIEQLAHAGLVIEGGIRFGAWCGREHHLSYPDVLVISKEERRVLNRHQGDPESGAIAKPEDDPGLHQQIRTLLSNSGLFDPEFYASQNADVVAAGMDLLDHYIKYGGREGRNPTAKFDAKAYIAAHPAAVENPLLHYLTEGIPAASDLGRSEPFQADISVNDPDFVSGLVQLRFDVSGPPSSCVLRAFAAQSDLITKEFSCPGQFWIGLNSHLLPNGPVSIQCSITAGESEVWRGDLRINVVNTSPLARMTADSLRRFGTPLATDGIVDASHYDYRDQSLAPWFDRPDAHADIARRLRAGEIDEIEARRLADFVDDGFLVLEQVIGGELLAAVNHEIDMVIRDKYCGYEYGSSQRLEGLHWRYPGIHKIWRHDVVHHYLRLIFKSEPRCCQTLTYIFGSQQGPHQDTVYLTPFPAGYMCGVWVALEDVRPDSGELEVYKGSHRLPRVYMHTAGCERGNDDEFRRKISSRWQQMLEEQGCERIVYRAKAGDALIWHENLMHAGSPRIDKSVSRRSIVSHVFADGALAFYDSSGVPGYMVPVAASGIAVG